MAVENKYVHAGLVDATRETVPAHIAQGTNVACIQGTFEVAAADDNDSIYRFIKGIPAGVIPVALEIACDAVTGMSDVNVGLYKTNLGDVVDENVLADALDLSSAITFAAPKDGLKDVNIADRQKTLWELAGQTIRNKATVFDIAMKAVAAASTAGTISYKFWFLNP